MAPRKRKGAVTSEGAEIVNSMQNGLADVCGVGLGGGINPFQGNRSPEQISDSTTIFKNLRWYLVSNFRQMLSQAYVEIGLIQTIVDVPVDDGLRGGAEIKSKQLNEEQIEDLQTSVDRDDILTIAGQAAKWNRLFGGAGILVLTDQDPETPLELDQINKDSRLEFRAVDMWELFWDKQNSEGYDPAIQTEGFDHYNYYGEQVHISRVMRLKGITAPSFIRPRLRGWGFSVVETLVRSINQYLKATDLGFEVLDEFKLDVYKIKNLTSSLLSPVGEDAIKRRIQIANYSKNYQNAIVMDSEDDFDHKQLSFAGLSDAMDGIRMQVASDMRMPMLKLFGTPSKGLNASDEDSIEIYNSMVESQVRNKLKYDLLRIYEIKCQQLFGFIPDDLTLTFKPLRVLSAVEEETVKTQKFMRLIQSKAAGELTTEEFRDACNKGNLFDVMLDTTDAALNDIADQAAEGDQDPKKPKDTDDPGANRADTRKSRATETGGVGKEPVQKNADDWDESKHPRADDGKFGVSHTETSTEEGKRFGDPVASKEIRLSTSIRERAGYFFVDVKTGKDIDASQIKAPKGYKLILISAKGTQPSSNLYSLKLSKVEKNEITFFPPPFTTLEKASRAVSNSAAFDKASYEADGGDAWIDPRRKEFFSNPGNVDEALWSKAKSASQKALGSVKWQFVTWWYKKQGGKFT